MGHPNEKLSFEQVRALLDYDLSSGEMVWKISRMRVIAGDRAGTTRKDGGRQVYIGSRLYMEHRLIWLWMTGAFPIHEIDHVDRDRSNNRWENLREATRAQNAMNVRIHRDNPIGVKGVTKRRNRFEARIGIGGKYKYLGIFDTKEEASAAYLAAAAAAYPDFATAGV